MFFTIIGLIAAGVGGYFLWKYLSKKSEPAPAPVTPGNPWIIGPIVNGQNFSVGMPAQPIPDGAGGVYFDFPAAQGSIHAMIRAAAEPSRSKVIALFAVQGDAQFISTQDGGPGCVTIHFQRSGDNWSGQGAYASYRWYAGSKATPLASGEFIVEIPLSPDAWGNVIGMNGNTDPAGFVAAVAEMDNIGFAFGNPGAGATAHGVHVNGSARFICRSFSLV